jgi:hypothetical protein
MTEATLSPDYQRTDASLVYEVLAGATYDTARGYHLLPLSTPARTWEVLWVWQDVYSRGTDTHGYRDMADAEPMPVVCAACGNGPLDVAEATVGTCSACTWVRAATPDEGR